MDFKKITRMIIDELNQSMVTHNVSSKLTEAFLHFSLSNNTQFFEEITKILLQSVANYKKSKRVSILIQIFKALIEKLKSIQNPPLKLQNFVENFIKFLLEYLDTKESDPRLGFTLILSFFLPLEIWGFSSTSKTFCLTKEKVVQLLQDRCVGVRKLAIGLAARLGLEHEIINTTLKDPLKDIRFKSLCCVFASYENLNVFSKYLEDIEEEIRAVAVKKIVECGVEKANSEVLKTVILRYGQERSSAVSNLLKLALHGCVEKFGIIGFVDKLDLHTFGIKEQSHLIQYLNKSVCEMETEVIFKETAEVYLPFIVNRSENISEVLTAVVFIEALHQKSPKLVHSLLDPNVIFPLLGFIHPLFSHFFTDSIIRISLCLDIYEENIRSQLVYSLLSIIKTFPVTLTLIKSVKNIEETYFKLQFDQFFCNSSAEVIKFSVRTIRILVQQYIHEFPNMISEILSEIRESLEESETKKSLFSIRKTLKIKLDTLDDEIQALDSEIHTREINFELERKNKEAYEIEEKIEEIDSIIVERLYRSLLIVTEMLKELKHGVLILDFEDYINKLILTALDKDEEILQIAAYECLTQCILHSEALLPTYQYLYSQVLRRTDRYLELVVVLSLFDIYMVHAPVQQTCSDVILQESVLATLLKYTQNINPYIQAVALEGFCKLIINNHIDSVIVLSVLIFTFIDMTQQVYIKQNLQVFFNNLDINIQDHPETVLSALKVFMSVACERVGMKIDLKLVDLSSIDGTKVFNFVWNKFESVRSKKEKPSFEVDLLFFYLSEILARPNSDEAFVYSKLVSQMSFNKLRSAEVVLVQMTMTQILSVTENKQLSDACSRLTKLYTKQYASATELKALQQSLAETHKKALELIHAFKKMFLTDTKATNFSSKSKKITPNSQNRVKIPYSTLA